MDDGTLTTRKRIFAASKNEINGLGGKPNKIVKLYIYENCNYKFRKFIDKVSIDRNARTKGNL
jgi:hypothetical protein